MTRTKRSRTSTRRLFRAWLTAAQDEMGRLDIARGRWSKTVDAEGNEVATTRENAATLWSNIGDLLIISSADPAVDRISAVEVVSVDQAGRPCVRVLRGEMPCGDVLIQPYRKARPATKRAPRASQGPLDESLVAMVRAKRGAT